MLRTAASLCVVCLLIALPIPAGETDRIKPTHPTRPPGLDETIDVEIRQPPNPDSPATRDRLLGNMARLRPWLADLGMTLELTSVDEGFASGGGDQGGESGRSYHGLTDLILSLDTGAAGLWHGGLVVVDLQNTRGGDISDIVGDLQGVSNIVAPPGTRITEYYLYQELADGSFAFKLGKQDANTDFVVSEGGGEFINSSFGLIPTVPLPTYPAPALGAMVSWQANEWMLLKAGLWDGDPKLGSGCTSSTFDGHGGAVGAADLEIAAFGGTVLPGTYRVGVWHHSEVEFATVKKDAAAHETGRASGLYFTVDQGLWEREDRRLAFFAQGGRAESDRSSVSRYLGAGLVLEAPFNGRPNDTIGIGVAHAEVGLPERLEAECTSETVVELTYHFALSGWMTVIPDFQWIHRPSGIDGTDLVAGLRVVTVF